jgi:RNA polymerase sigma-70 factor (ECF subfamily)
MVDSHSLDGATAVQLLRRVGQRDKEAFVELFRAINRRVFLFAKHRLGDREDAEEVLNDTAMELWQHPERFRGDSRFMTYVLGIANNKANSLLRRRDRLEEDTADDMEDVPDCESTPYETVWRKEKLAAIAACMEHLPERQRTIVYLAYFEDLSRQEIGRIVNCEENAVRQYLHQALRKMKGCLSASGLMVELPC